MCEEYSLEDSFYNFTPDDRVLLAQLKLKEDDLGRYRGITSSEEHIIVSTRDRGALSMAMCNHDAFFKAEVVEEGDGYVDYYFYKQG